MSTLTSLAYLIAAVLFILSIRGLSSPTSARQGITLGIIGMAIAVVTTMLMDQVHGWTLPILGIGIGGLIGTTIAKKVDFRDLPQLVALFNAFVGLASVFIALAAFINPEPYGIAVDGIIAKNSLLEMSLGAIIGAITFTGSVIAFGKLQGIVTVEFIFRMGRRWCWFHDAKHVAYYCWCACWGIGGDFVLHHV